MNLSEREKTVVKLLQGDLPLVSRPYEWVGKQAGLPEQAVLEIIESLVSRGIIRKLAAVVRHRRVGYVKNALVIWAVPPDRIEDVGKFFATHKYVSHCYERTPPYLERYNLFTMIHYPPEGQVDIIESLATVASIKDYVILESVEELKKTSPSYL